MTREERAAIAERNGLYIWQVCGACGVADQLVEDGGISYCPNPFCRGSGGGQLRHVRACAACRSHDTAGDHVQVDEACAELQFMMRHERDLFPSRPVQAWP